MVVIEGSFKGVYRVHLKGSIGRMVVIVVIILPHSFIPYYPKVGKALKA